MEKCPLILSPNGFNTKLKHSQNTALELDLQMYVVA